MLARTPHYLTREPVWALPICPGYFDAVRAHNAALAALAQDCTACRADYAAANDAFSEALRALPDGRMKRDAAHAPDPLEMPGHRSR